MGVFGTTRKASRNGTTKIASHKGFSLRRGSAKGGGEVL